MPAGGDAMAPGAARETPAGMGRSGRFLAPAADPPDSRDASRSGRIAAGRAPSVRIGAVSIRPGPGERAPFTG